MKSKNLPRAYDCSGKTALITGGAGLLGVQHALALLEIGADIILTDINFKKLIQISHRLKKNYPSAAIFPAILDVTDPEQIRRFSNNLPRKTKRVDILINNATLDPKVQKKQKAGTKESRLETFPLGVWENELRVGLTGAFLCSQVFGTKMAGDGKGGIILNIASDLSVIAPDQRLYRKKGISDAKQLVKPVTYSVIKTGLVGLTRYLSTYWPKKGVRANALSPGGIFHNQPNSFVKKIENLIPMGRMARPQEYRAALQFLCSDASAYLNGQNIVIDGGRSTW